MKETIIYRRLTLRIAFWGFFVVFFATPGELSSFEYIDLASLLFPDNEFVFAAKLSTKMGFHIRIQIYPDNPPVFFIREY